MKLYLLIVEAFKLQQQLNNLYYSIGAKVSKETIM